MPRKKLPAPAPEPRLLDIKSAAAYLSTTIWNMRVLASSGRVPTVRLGQRRLLFDRVDLDRLIEERKNHGRAA